MKMDFDDFIVIKYQGVLGGREVARIGRTSQYFEERRSARRMILNPIEHPL
jgi:hypothetical protein